LIVTHAAPITNTALILITPARPRHPCEASPVPKVGEVHPPPKAHSTVTAPITNTALILYHARLRTSSPGLTRDLRPVRGTCIVSPVRVVVV
jgi:hypothetical protein